MRRAARAWIEPWPGIIERWTVNGEMPALGLAMNGNYLVTAWRGDASEPVIPLPPSVHPLSRVDDGWTGSRAGTPRSGEMWPCDWTRDHVQQQIDEWLKNRDLLAEIEVCWPELAWDYAHRILHRDPVVRSEPVPRADLAAAVSEVRARFPAGDVQVERGRYGWRLTEAEAFVRDLARLGVHELAPVIHEGRAGQRMAG